MVTAIERANKHVSLINEKKHCNVQKREMRAAVFLFFNDLNVAITEMKEKRNTLSLQFQYFSNDLHKRAHRMLCSKQWFKLQKIDNNATNGSRKTTKQLSKRQKRREWIKQQIECRMDYTRIKIKWRLLQMQKNLDTWTFFE